MKIALYRKYRPKSFEEMLGQDHVTQTLKNAIKDLAHSHAYMFTGPRGVGKTSAARLVAVSINCENGKNGESCGKCESCISIFNNKAIDIIEIDAASNRGIDEIRELKEKVKFSPNRLKYKVFIIDEVHMLTKEAFNALLKTLEEPPAHAVFVLATTEIHKVPQTILSRCQRFDFKRITLKNLLAQLKEIAKKEDIKITDEALSLIAESSEGGFRDAISYLDQISSYKKDEISAQDVVDLLGMSDYKSLLVFTDFLAKRNAKEAIGVLNNLMENGVEANQFTKNCIEFLRKLLLFKVLGEEHIELAEEHLKSIRVILTDLSQEEISNFIEVILENSNKFKNSPVAQLPLEISVVEICSVETGSIQIKEFSLNEKQEKRVEEKEEKIETGSEDAGETLRVAQVKKDSSLNDVKRNREVANDKFSTDSTGSDSVSSNDNSGSEKEHWHDLLLEVKGANPSCHALLKACKFEFQDNELKLMFPFKFHKERMEDRKNKKVVDEALKRVYNKSYTIKCIVKEEIKETMKKEIEVKKKELAKSALEIFQGELVE